ncbi:BCCT family transporter [Acetobacterium malicum]|uniref:BCCT family transporter n=1 Tax=Acetobacterium malicum TaxID=52692 RepID=UPI00041CE5FE|nr:BCCT family transporter [Acetobacterium dehalogenans]
MLKRIRIVPVAIPIVLMGIILIIGFIVPEQFTTIMTDFFIALMENAGWMVSIGVLIFVGCMVLLFVHPFGSIKFGGKDALPKYKTWIWWAISLCAGIGTGIVFWGATEPLMHTFTPPPSVGLEPGSLDAVIWGMSKSFLHWSFSPYSIYAVAGITIGYAYYNMNKSYTASAGLVYLNDGKELNSKINTIIDGIILFAICGGVAGSLGYGLLQIGSGLNFVFGIEPGPFVWAIIAAVIITSYTISSATGLDRGIAWLSDKNAWIFIALMIFVLVCGPTAYIFNLFTQSFGYFVNNFVDLSLFTQPIVDSDLWPQWWDMYWMVDWLSFGPIVGLFLVKLSYGRTIREFITVNVILPAMFGILWFSIFGGLALDLQLRGVADMSGFLADNGAQAFMMYIFEFLPFTELIRIIMLVTIGLSFITLADSMTSTISTMSLKQSKGVKEAPLPIKVFWGVFIGLISLVFVISGGIDGIKIVKTIAGFPILFIELAMILGFLYHLFSGKLKRDELEYADFMDGEVAAAAAEAEAELADTHIHKKWYTLEKQKDNKKDKKE